MSDREKVIKAFEICDNNEDGIVCKNCPYKEDKWNGAWEDETGKTCFQTLHADVLAMLKEQEKPNGKCVNECECWDSAYERGKQDALKEQEAEIRQLRLALDIMKGKGIVVNDGLKHYDDGSVEP